METLVVKGDKFRFESGIVFIVDDIQESEKFGALVCSSLEGGKKGSYRDSMEDFLAFMQENKAEKIQSGL
jgi:hypothetical protein